MKFLNTTSSKFSKLLLIVYSCVLLYTGVMALKKPAYNFDMLPYMGVILSYDEPDHNQVHQQVYHTAQIEVKEPYYNRMLDPGNEYRNNMATSSAVFTSQFPFYVVKPLYTGIAYLFFKAGTQLSVATVWPSVIAYIGCGLLLFFWCIKYTTPLIATLASTTTIISPPFLTAAGLSTPDALSAFLLFTAIYLATETKQLLLATGLLLLSIFARADNLVAACFLIIPMIFNKKENRRKELIRFALYCITFSLAFLLVCSGAKQYGWSALYYPSFIDQLNASYHAQGFSLKEYFALAKTQLSTGLYFSLLSLFLLLAVLLMAHYYSYNKDQLPIEKKFLLLFLLIIVIRFTLQPLIADRFYLPYYLSIVAFMMKVFANNRLLIQMQRA